MSNKEYKIKSTVDAFGLIGIIFSVLGLVFILLAGGFFISNQLFMKDAEKTVGVIKSIEQISGKKADNESNSHNVTVAYEINGKQYEENLSEYSSDMREGQKIELYYHTGKEEDVRTGKVNAILSFVFGILGIGFGLCGLIFDIKIIKKRKKSKYLLENGRQVYAQLTSCDMNKKMRVNGRHPFNIECRYFDEFTGDLKIYRAQNVMANLEGYIGSQVTVYVDPTDESSYEVDLNSLLNNQ